jgi:hypothetical protein
MESELEGGLMRSRFLTDNLHRRKFLGDLGTGFSSVVLAAMLHRDGIAGSQSASESNAISGKPHFAPKAKNVIWLFMVGGASHMESFDPKPALNKYEGKTIAETPFGKEVLESPFLKKNARDVFNIKRKFYPKIFPMQVGYAQRGETGTEVSNWWPHVGRSIDDIAVVRSMWTTDVDHGAQLQFHTGRHKLDGVHPTIGSWVHYGLGSLDGNLPQFVVMGQGIADCCGGQKAQGADYLGPSHAGVGLQVDPRNPLPFAGPGGGRFREEQQAEFELINKLNRLSQRNDPDDPAVEARIRSYELAYRMQTAVPDLFQFQEESNITRGLYGLDKEVTRPFGEICLAARRMVEQGVKFVQIFHGGNGGAGRWDAHRNLRNSHAQVTAQVDRPIGGLLQDLKQRGLLDETLVVWATEFGRSPGAQGNNGRDHHPFGFSVWMAGGGIKGGVIEGATDELGFHAVENRHYVTDVHATVLHQLGLDPRRLAIPGRKRLDIDFGEPIHPIIA